MAERRILTAITILSFAGLAIASYSFLHNQSLVSGGFCNIGETFSCDVVNRGPFSKFFGAPVSLIGVIGYLFLAALAGYLTYRPQDRGVRIFLLLAALGGLGFSAYLTGIEAFVLHTWCLLCLSSQVIMALIFALTIWFTARGKRSYGSNINAVP